MPWRCDVGAWIGIIKQRKFRFVMMGSSTRVIIGAMLVGFSWPFKFECEVEEFVGGNGGRLESFLFMVCIFRLYESGGRQF